MVRSSLLGGACFAALMSIPAVAQDNGGVETIVVTGLRGSLQRSMDIKRQSTGVVDAVTSEDIGKFPDVNLADSMMRIPGITVTRGVSSLGSTGGTTTTGDATEITVRGFGPTFNQTLYDGRVMASPVGNTQGQPNGDRAFDFSSLNSDFVGQIDILKTPDTTLSAGAIGATINVKFLKPFDHPGLTIAGSASGNVSPDNGKIEPNASILISDTFDNDHFGILVDASYSNSKTRQNHINNQAWVGTTGGYTAVGLNNTVDVGTPTWYEQDVGVYNEHSTIERMQGRVALQWRPADNFQITVNDDFSRYHNSEIQHGFSVWFSPGSFQNVQTDSHGTVINFQQTTPTDFQAQYNSEVLQFNDYGVNVQWNVSDNLTISLDADHADGWLNPGAQNTVVDADVGYGNALDNTVLGITIPAGHGIPFPNGFGPNGDKSQYLNPALIGSHVLVIQSNRNLDAINQVKAEADWGDETAMIKFGLQYVAEHKNEALFDDFGGAVGVSPNNWQAYAGYGPGSGNPPGNGVALPASFFTQSFSTKGFINGWSGSSNLPPRILAADPFQILNYLNGLHGAGASTTCCTPAFTGTYQIGAEPASGHVLSENTFSGFLEGTFKTQLSGIPLKVNVGARYDITSDDVTGFGRLPVSFTQSSADPTNWNTNFATPNAVPITQTHQYQYLLPNFDLIMSLTDTLDLRFDASRTLTRPPVSSLNPVPSVTTARIGNVQESVGNAALLPFLADNLDVGMQWYYQSNSYISFDAFLKSVDNFVISHTTPGDFGVVGTETVDPVTKIPFGAPRVIDVPFTINSPVNGPAANVYGFEASWQYVFGDTGYGFQVNGTIVGTDKPYNPNDLSTSGFAVTGLADSANMVVFYDKDGFQLRIAANWQDSYLDHFGQLQGGSSFGTEPTFVNTNWNMDISTSYDLTDQVTIYGEAMNVTDATYSTHGRFSNQFLDVVDYGRKFIFGVHFKY